MFAGRTFGRLKVERALIMKNGVNEVSGAKAIRGGPSPDSNSIDGSVTLDEAVKGGFLSQRSGLFMNAHINSTPPAAYKSRGDYLICTFHGGKVDTGEKGYYAINYDINP